MKKLIALLLFFTLGTMPLLAGTIEKEFSYRIEDFNFDKIGAYDVIWIDEATSNMDIGAPMLPRISVKLLIPPTATVTSIEIVSFERQELDGAYNIIPVQQPAIISAKTAPEFIEPNSEIYGSSSPYPGKLVSEKLHNGTKCGFRIASFHLYPLQYIPWEKKLMLYTNIRFRLHYEEGRYPARHVTERQQEVFGPSVERLVINDEALSRYSPPLHTARGPYGDWEMVIIAPNNAGIIDELQVLADWKTQKGLPCMVKNVQDIYDDYAGNNPWKIKQFIDEMVSYEGTIWVFLFGDSAYSGTEGITCRGVWYSDGTDLPCDRFFEDLDNNWNYDGDSRYGEHSDGPGGGELDWYADCYVGRAFPPAGGVSSAQTYVNRIIWFEKTPDADFTTRAIFSSCQLFSTARGYVRTDDMASYIPGAWDIPGGGNGHPGFEFDQGLDDYPGDASFLQYELSDGYQFYGTCAHGHYSVFMGDYNVGSQYITSTEVYDNFDPGMRCGVFTGNSCLWGGFDQMDCCAEFLYHFGMTGGACNSRSGWGYNSNNLPYIHLLSDGICWQFFVQIFNNDVFHLGEAVAEVKDYFVDELDDDTWNWCLKEYNTYGDPELTLWNASTAPPTLHATHAAVVPTGPSTFDVNVSDGSKAPVNNALVCLWCETERSMYVTGYTNGSGNVSLAINPTIDNDIMWVTAAKHNYLPYEGEATVDEDLAVFLSEFCAVGLKGKAKLLWRTESETDNAYWLIERRGTEDNEWRQIATVAGQGNKPGPTDYEYCDDGMEHDGKYLYKLISVNRDGEKQTFGPVSVTVTGKKPRVFALHDAYPNPARGWISLAFDIPEHCFARMNIYNSAGQMIKTLVKGELAPGFYDVLWEGDGDGGRKVGHGVYFISLNAGDYQKTTKVLLIK
jgi:hypothetical protein